MADKRPVQGTVTSTSNNGKQQMEIGGKWYVLSPKASGVSLPAIGEIVAFDAYGRDYDIFYRWSVLGSTAFESVAPGFNQPVANGAGGQSSWPGPQPMPTRPENWIVQPTKQAALQAAATLLAGSDGSVEDLADRTRMVASLFEHFLKEKP